MISVDRPPRSADGLGTIGCRGKSLALEPHCHGREWLDDTTSSCGSSRTAETKASFLALLRSYLVASPPQLGGVHIMVRSFRFKEAIVSRVLSLSRAIRLDVE